MFRFRPSNKLFGSKNARKVMFKPDLIVYHLPLGVSLIQSSEKGNDVGVLAFHNVSETLVERSDNLRTSLSNLEIGEPSRK